MKYAAKSKKQVVKAYCLGAGSAMEAMLTERGRIRRLPDGQFELMSQEAKNGVGEIARAGDYFKVDLVEGEYYPYPNSRTYFLENHRHLDGDEYEQRPAPRAIWQLGDPMCAEIQFLLDTGRLTLKPEQPEQFFNAFLWGADLSAARDATIVFYQVDRDSSGAITDISFNFVAKNEFDSSYELCSPA